MGRFSLKDPITGKVIKYFNSRSELNKEELEQVRIQDREYYQIKAEIIKPRKRRDHWKNRDYNLKRMEIWRLNGGNIKIRIRKDKQRILVLTHYSDGEPKCECCGISQIAFLAIDHPDNYEGKYRSGSHLISWLIQNNFPIGFKVRCHNCNFARKDSPDKICPHKLNPNLLRGISTIG